MKNRLSITSLLLVVILTTLNTSIFAQASGDTHFETPRLYVGIGTGINAPGGGLGMYIEVPITQMVRFSGAAGYGSWGSKLTGTILFNKNPFGLKSSVGFGFSYALGNIDYNSELQFEQTGFIFPTESDEAEIDLQPGQSVNLIYNYSWKIGKKSKLTLHTGLAVNITPNNYELRNKKKLTEESKIMLRSLSPGGLIFGVVFNFGL
ncbi:MAG: hypothetical protein ACJAUV_001150 [Flavobacteriales bacterium]|jgi:hypothetical protein